MLTIVIDDYAKFAVFFALIVNLLYIVLLIISGLRIKRDSHAAMFPMIRRKDAFVFPPIAVIIPAYNEEVTAVETIVNLLKLDYPGLEIIFVNDGSKDSTLETVVEHFELVESSRQMINSEIEIINRPRGTFQNSKYPNLTVIDKANSGKGDTLNVGICYATSPLVAMIDADSLLDKESLFNMAQTFLEDPERVVSVGGYVRIGNGCSITAGQVSMIAQPRNILARCQMMEYAKAFVAGRTGWGLMNGLIIVSGAFGVFRRDLLVEIGGYYTKAPGEDMEIILKIHRFLMDRRRDYRIAFCPQAVCWTQAPEQWRSLSGQRRRWAKGNLANSLRFFGMLLRYKYGVVGLFSLPYVFFVEVLSPYIALTGIFAIAISILQGLQSASVIAWLFATNIVLDYVLGIGALILDDGSFPMLSIRQLLSIVRTALHMPFWYYYVNDFWRVRGHIEFFTNRHGWNEMTRVSWVKSK